MHVSSRLRGGALVGVLALAGALVVPATAYAAEPDVLTDPIRLDSGHIDAFNLILGDDNGVRMVLKEDVTGSHVLREPESVELFVKEQAKTPVPDGYLPGLSGEVYHLPLTQNHNLIWPGWDTQGVVSAFPGADTDFVVSAVDGPGDVFVWSQNFAGQPTSLTVDGGYTLPATISQPYPAHTHANWAFTEPGTYKLTAHADVTASNGATGSSAEHTYTFIVSEETAIAPAAPTQEGNTVTIPGQDWVTYTDTATGEVLPAGPIELTADLSVTATVADGFVVAGDSTTQWSFTHTAAPVEQTLTIAPLAGHYHQMSPIDLVATADPAAEGATYRWTLQRRDQSAAVVIDGATGASHRLTAEQALDGAVATAELLGADGAVLAASAPVTIHIDDHGQPPLQTVTVAGVSDHYHSGDTATLTASVDPASVLTRYEWYVQSGENPPALVPGANGPSYSFEVTESVAVTAKLTYADAAPYVSSAPVLVRLNDHHEVPATDLTISTNRAADDYWVGQTATLTAEQSVPTGLTEYVWLAKLPGTEDFTAVEGQTAATYKFKPTLANSGVQVKVQLLHDGQVHAESAPVTFPAHVREQVTTLTVTADKATYAPGETAQLVSSQNPQTDHDHWHWYVKRAGASDFVWVDQSRASDLAYPVTAEDEGAQLVLRMFDDTHAVIAESAPYTLHLTGAEPVPATELSISGLVAEGYRVGQTATLTAVQTPATDEDHYHWFIKRSGDEDYAVIRGQATGSYAHEVAAGDAGAQIVVKLYNHDHAVVAESAPVTLTVVPDAVDPTPTPTPTPTTPGTGTTPGTTTGTGTGTGAGTHLATSGGELPGGLLGGAALLLLAGGGILLALRKHREAPSAE